MTNRLRTSGGRVCRTSGGRAICCPQPPPDPHACCGSSLTPLTLTMHCPTLPGIDGQTITLNLSSPDQWSGAWTLPCDVFALYGLSLFCATGGYALSLVATPGGGGTCTFSLSGSGLTTVSCSPALHIQGSGTVFPNFAFTCCGASALGTPFTFDIVG